MSVEVPKTMEYSVASNSTSFSQEYGIPFPHLSSQPAVDVVTPGLGQMVNLYDVIVPMRGRSLHSIEKKVEKIEVTMEPKLEGKDQIGSGKLSAELAQSFQHPIITDSIVFPKEKKRKEIMNPTESKKLKLVHKFDVV